MTRILTPFLVALFLATAPMAASAAEGKWCTTSTIPPTPALP